MRKTHYLVRRTMPSGSVSWLYDWTDGLLGKVAVWTHDVHKAKPLNAFDSALAVSSARSEGCQADRVKLIDALRLMAERTR